MAEDTEEIKKKMQELVKRAETLGETMQNRPAVDTRGSDFYRVATADEPSKPSDSYKFDPKPMFRGGPGTNIIDSKVNAQIVLGPHMPKGEFSARLARGETGTASIDLVAGRLGVSC